MEKKPHLPVIYCSHWRLQNCFLMIQILMTNNCTVISSAIGHNTECIAKQAAVDHTLKKNTWHENTRGYQFLKSPVFSSRASSMYIAFPETWYKLKDFYHIIPCVLVSQIQEILNSLLKAFQIISVGENMVLIMPSLWIRCLYRCSTSQKTGSSTGDTQKIITANSKQHLWHGQRHLVQKRLIRNKNEGLIGMGGKEICNQEETKY